MKGGKRKKQASNDTPFNEIIDQMKNINGKCIPCMIDFEGYSIYHCDTPLHPIKKYQNIFLARYFIHWQKYIDIKNQLHIYDLSSINKYDTHILAKCFYDWKTKYIQLSRANIILYFTKWQTRFDDNRLRSFHIEHFGKRAFLAWKLVVHRSKTVGKYQKRQMKKYFIILKKLYEGSNFRTKEFQKKSLIITSLTIKKQYFKKWAMKAKNHQLIKKKENFQNSKRMLQLKLPFSHWRKNYFLHLFIHKRSKVITKDAFEFWKKSKDVKQNFLNKMNEIQSFHNKQILHIVVQKWKRKYKLKRNKKRKANIKLWSLVVYHEIIYAQFKQKINYNIQYKIFAYMKKQTRNSIKEIAKRIFNQWRQITFLQTAEKSISQNYLRIKLETCFITWRMRLHKMIDERMIIEIRKEVVERNCMLHYFKIWISKSLHIYRKQMKIAKKFRRRKLISYHFIAWKNSVKLKELRARQFLGKILLAKYFQGFKMYARKSYEKKYKQAILRDNYRIKKKYFNIMKKILETRGFHYHNNNDEDQIVIRLINRTHNFLHISRLEYI